MPISKIKGSAINDDAINTDRLEDNIEIAGTEAARMPVGSTAQRSSAQSGDIRFNSSLSLMEYYDGTEWKSIDSPPVLNSISPTTETDANANITLSGSNFQSGATVKFVGDDGTEYSSPSVTFTNSSEVIAQTPNPALSVANEPYDVKLTNPSGLSSTITDALDAGGVPTFNTSAGTYNIYDSLRSNSFDAGATDPDGDTITYSISAGSLPAGASINSSTGAITGFSAVSSDTASTFTVSAATSSDTSTREFTLNVKAPVETTYVYTGSDQSFTLPSDIDTFSVYMWGAGGGGERSTSPSGGASGGFVSGTIDITDSSFVSSYGANTRDFTIVAGRGGNQHSYFNGENRNPFYGGGGYARDLYNGAGSEIADGGGLSGIFANVSSTVYSLSGTANTSSGSYTANVTTANVVAIAGGGGGAGDSNQGGAGGGLTGGTGGGGSAGGTQSAGGAGTDEAQGLFLLGGATYDLSSPSQSSNAIRGGAGGGGYYGGAGADSDRNAGGGGSSYVGGLTSNVVNTQGSNGSNSTTTAAPENSNAYYPGNDAEGYPTGSGGIGNGGNGDGGHGAVVIVY